MATKRQKKIIHMLKNNLGLEDDVYRDMLEQYSGHRSSKDISAYYMHLIIQDLKETATKMGLWKSKDYGRDPGLISYKQMGKIKGLWRDVSYIKDRSKRIRALDKFLKKRWNTTLEFVEKSQAGGIIYTLQEMKKDNYKRKGSKA